MKVLGFFLFDLSFLGFCLMMCDLLMQLELVRFVASYKPLIAGAKVSERSIAIIKHLLLSQMPAQVWL